MERRYLLGNVQDPASIGKAAHARRVRIEGFARGIAVGRR